MYHFGGTVLSLTKGSTTHWPYTSSATSNASSGYFKPWISISLYIDDTNNFYLVKRAKLGRRFQ
ncbi:hypothetical protein DASC09_053680 [Saccharomycopsis crataegensis]|uniref:Uncharacterized protein n=1 Tax=Saccharomycopsis crataegensis TaxID=43959 RepID=A0AAV5QSZ7_9ASCO|nr:hypothetical protein DASC09_053680 [Saccharomycopsis crataegensis]